MATMAIMNRDELVDAFEEDTLTVTKWPAGPGSTMDNYWTFEERNRVIHIAMDVDETADIILWLRNSEDLI
jgi:hypothetical protein